MVRDEMAGVLKGPTIRPKGSEGESLPYQRALDPGLGLEDYIIRHECGHLLFPLLIETTSVASDDLPNVMSSLE